MKIKKGIALRNVSGTSIIVSVSENKVNYENIFSLNETGILLWKSLEQGAKREELQQILRNEYEVDEATVREDVEEFLNKLRLLDVLEE